MPMFTFNTNPPKCSVDSTMFTLSKPSVLLFDTVARSLAEEINSGKILVSYEERDRQSQKKITRWKIDEIKDINKPTQLRKFYDEICMWSDKTKSTNDLENNLPFIKMLNAKVAYARGRELVDDKFVTWFASCLDQIKSGDETSLAAFRNFRLLFEALVGFYKVLRPK